MRKSILVKFCLLGDGAVGKTAIRKRYTSGQFTDAYLMTLGAEFAIKKLQKTIDGTPCEVKMQIWDLAGQVSFTKVRKLYYSGATGGFLVYDVTKRESYENLLNWTKELFANNGRGIVPIVILGNKIDLREENNPNADYLTYDDGMALVEKIREEYPEVKVGFLETSAKTGENIVKLKCKFGI